MTNRTEKPSQHESSTDTLIGALNIIADLLDTNPDQQYMIEAISVREAAQRLDKLEKELEDMRAKQKTIRDEFAMSFISGDADWTDYQKMANMSYVVADAMMEARKQ